MSRSLANNWKYADFLIKYIRSKFFVFGKMEGNMNFPNLTFVGNLINFLFGLPPYILVPILVICGYLLIRAVVSLVSAQAKSAAGALIIIILVFFVCIAGLYLFSNMPNILRALDKLYYPMLHF